MPRCSLRSLVLLGKGYMSCNANTHITPDIQTPKGPQDCTSTAYGNNKARHNVIMLGLFLIVAVLSLWSDHTCDAFGGVITADNHVDVYVDGQHIGENVWGGDHIFDLPDSARVIGLQGSDWSGLGGVIASFSDGLLTGASDWKCSSTYTPGWAYPEFDDSAWVQATAYLRPDGKIPAGVNNTAKWIWTAGYEFVDKIVFCRHLTDVVTGNWTADNALDVFIDGVHFAHASWVAAAARVPLTSKVVGMRGFNWGGLGGIIASFSCGMKTDNRWKCSATYSEGWATVDFDDSSWAQATAYVRPDGYIPEGVNRKAKWIWTENYDDGDKVVYCRISRV